MVFIDACFPSSLAATPDARAVELTNLTFQLHPKWAGQFSPSFIPESDCLRRPRDHATAQC
jgi:hypothetical protein